MSKRRIYLTLRLRRLIQGLGVFNIVAGVVLLWPGQSLTDPSFHVTLSIMPEWAWGVVWCAVGLLTLLALHWPDDGFFRSVFVVAGFLDMVWGFTTLFQRHIQGHGIFLPGAFFFLGWLRYLIARAEDEAIKVVPYGRD